MEEDTRLFASNNPIGRIWYFINIIILAIVTIATKVLVLEYILPNANPSFNFAIKCILYFAYYDFINAA